MGPLTRTKTSETFELLTYLERRGAVGSLTPLAKAFKRLEATEGFEGLMVFDRRGIPVRSTLDHDDTLHWAALVNFFTKKVRDAVRKIDPQDDLLSTRVRSRKHEVIITPCFAKNQEYCVVLIHAPKLHEATSWCPGNQ